MTLWVGFVATSWGQILFRDSPSIG